MAAFGLSVGIMIVLMFRGMGVDGIYESEGILVVQVKGIKPFLPDKAELLVEC